MEAAHHGRPADPVADAEAARDELRDALAEADILLPSLGLDPVTYGGGFLPPLVDLGRCNPRVARKLAAALRAGLPHDR